MLTGRLGARPAWDSYDFAAYNRRLTEAISSGERIYSAAYIVPNPPFGEARKHGNHLRLIEHAMATRLPQAVASAASLPQLYALLTALPSLGPFLAFQFAIDFGYADIAAVDEDQFIVAGPGALDGISKCFVDTGGLSAAEVIAWMRDTSPEHFARLGLRFDDLRGRWPTLIDWQNVFCETSKYTRLSHPHVLGQAGRTRIKQQFRHGGTAIDYRFRRSGACRPSGRRSSEASERRLERERPRGQVAAQDAAAMQPYGSQASQASANGMRPVVAGPDGYF